MKKVIIIGAGPAGLTAGYELLNGEEGKDYEVVILEEVAIIFCPILGYGITQKNGIGANARGEHFGISLFVAIELCPVFVRAYLCMRTFARA